MYLPSREQFRIDCRIRKEWVFLRKAEGRQALCRTLWVVGPPMLHGVARWQGWLPSGNDGALLMNVALMLAAFVPAIVMLPQLWRRPASLRNAGACFGCGAQRCIDSELCWRCGVEIAPQIVHEHAIRHLRAGRWSIPGRMFAWRLGLAAAGPIIFVVAWVDIGERYGIVKRDDPNLFVNWPFMLCFVSLALILLLVLFVVGGRPIDRKLEELRGKCQVCATPLPPESEAVEWCATCGASLLFRREMDEAVQMGRARRSRAGA